MAEFGWRYPNQTMSQRMPCPAAPGPLEEYAAQFDELFGSLAQRRGFRDYLHGLLVPRDRNKTLTALVGAEPVVGAQHREVQRLQFFLSESGWNQDEIKTRRLEGLQSAPTTRAHDNGALVIDETGDRKDGTKTAHVSRQYLGSVGKTDNGIVAVSSLWADEHVSYPLDVLPYTPAPRLAKGKADPAFRTKPQSAVELVDAALDVGVSFRAVVADCLDGDNPTFERALEAASLPFVLGVKPSRSIWAPEDEVHSPAEAAAELRWNGPDDPGDWTTVVRRFRDGHAETWWAVDLSDGPYGPDQSRRMIVATTDPATLPDLTTWYLTTNLPHPERDDLAEIPFAPADLAEIVRLYALRNWVEQSYKQVKQELGWADLMVRTDRAIRRHGELVCCAFTFCWRHWFGGTSHLPPGPVPEDPATDDISPRARDASRNASTGPGENGGQAIGRALGGSYHTRTVLAAGPPARPRLAPAVDHAHALLAGVVRSAPTAGGPGAPGLDRCWPSP